MVLYGLSSNPTREVSLNDNRECCSLYAYRKYRTVFTSPILSGYLTRINETRIVKLR